MGSQDLGARVRASKDGTCPRRHPGDDGWLKEYGVRRRTLSSTHLNSTGTVSTGCTYRYLSLPLAVGALDGGPRSKTRRRLDGWEPTKASETTCIYLPSTFALAPVVETPSSLGLLARHMATNQLSVASGASAATVHAPRGAASAGAQSTDARRRGGRGRVGVGVGVGVVGQGTTNQRIQSTEAGALVGARALKDEQHVPCGSGVQCSVGARAGPRIEASKYTVRRAGRTLRDGRTGDGEVAAYQGTSRQATTRQVDGDEVGSEASESATQARSAIGTTLPAAPATGVIGGWARRTPSPVARRHDEAARPGRNESPGGCGGGTGARASKLQGCQRQGGC
ncbi:hypothetical protein RJ55_07665 [Drechmeria coniospora]|nr:hypothetical protein RJ55_07665 [Drechmeria coniospora]